MKRGYVYFLANKNKTTLYIGVTSNLLNRIYEHKTKLYKKSFTSQYSINVLVYFEFYDTIEGAIDREKQLKAGSRKKKDELINQNNSSWKDLSGEIEDCI